MAIKGEQQTTRQQTVLLGRVRSGARQRRRQITRGKEEGRRDGYIDDNMARTNERIVTTRTDAQKTTKSMEMEKNQPESEEEKKKRI